MIKPILSIIIVSYNTAKITEDCIKSVLADKKLDFNLKSDSQQTIPSEIIVVDNNSPDDSVERIKKFKQVKLLENKNNSGFGGGNNQAFEKSLGNYVLLLNPDTVVLHGAISQTLDWLAAHPEAGIAGCQLLNPDKSIQQAGGYFPNLANIFTWTFGLDDMPLVNSLIKPIHPHTPDFYTKDKFYLFDRKLDWICGAFMLMRREIYEAVGGFDENYFMYGEELELCYRIKQSKPNYENWYLVGPQTIHIGGASSTKSYPIIKEMAGMIKFFEKHKPKWQARLVKWLIKLNPSIRLRWLAFSIFNREKALVYKEICKGLSNY